LEGFGSRMSTALDVGRPGSGLSDRGVSRSLERREETCSDGKKQTFTMRLSLQSLHTFRPNMSLYTN